MADGSSQLSDGVIIETSVLARLLGIKLLTIEGTVLVSPAQVREGYQAPATPAIETRRELPAAGLNGGAAARSGAVSGEAVGARLGMAARLLAESSQNLRRIETKP